MPVDCDAVRHAGKVHPVTGLPVDQFAGHPVAQEDRALRRSARGHRDHTELCRHRDMIAGHRRRGHAARDGQGIEGADVFGLPVITPGRQHHPEICTDALVAIEIADHHSLHLAVLDHQIGHCGGSPHRHPALLRREHLRCRKARARTALARGQMPLVSVMKRNASRPRSMNTRRRSGVAKPCARCVR